MAPSLDEVRKLFKYLESGDGAFFFDHGADNVDSTVEGTHPLAGHHHSKADFREHTFKKLGKVLPGGVQLHVTHSRLWRLGAGGVGIARDHAKRSAFREQILLDHALREQSDRGSTRLPRLSSDPEAI
jgi:ketosteroid isomerase-like protein